MPLLLLQRCNGTTAGLGHLEVGWNAHTQIPLQAVNLWLRFHVVGCGQSELDDNSAQFTLADIQILGC